MSPDGAHGLGVRPAHSAWPRPRGVWARAGGRGGSAPAAPRRRVSESCAVSAPTFNARALKRVALGQQTRPPGGGVRHMPQVSGARGLPRGPGMPLQLPSSAPTGPGQRWCPLGLGAWEGRGSRARRPARGEGKGAARVRPGGGRRALGLRLRLRLGLAMAAAAP